MERRVDVIRHRGRPPRIAGEPASERIWGWLTPTERTALQRLSDKTGEPIAVIIREAVNTYVADSGDGEVFSVTGKSGHAVA